MTYKLADVASSLAPLVMQVVRHEKKEVTNVMSSNPYCLFIID